jgi:sugar phosphate isomerase/epimerase
MLRAFSSLGCPDFNLDQTLALAAKHRIGAVELRTLGGTVELPAYFIQHFGTPEELAERVKASGVQVVAFDASLHLVGATQNERQQLVAFGRWAEALGVKWLRVFDGGKTGDSAELAEAVKTIGWWEGVRRERDWRVNLMVETHDSLFTAAKILQFLEAAPGTAILWDSHHTWRKGGEEPLATWRAIRSHVVHVHVKDSIGQPSAKHPFTYVLPGTGEFPIAPLLAALRAEQFAGPVSLEWEKMWHPYLGPLDEALAAASARGWW